MRAASPARPLQVQTWSWCSIARLSGLSQEAIDACLKNEALQKGILAKAFEGQQTHKVESTPTFIVGKETLSGALPYEDFDRVLKKAAAGG